VLVIFSELLVCHGRDREDLRKFIGGQIFSMAHVSFLIGASTRISVRKFFLWPITHGASTLTCILDLETRYASTLGKIGPSSDKLSSESVLTAQDEEGLSLIHPVEHHAISKSVR
jgi:hypothetical protein